MNLLTLTIFLPLIGALAIIPLKKQAAGAVRMIALMTSVLTFIASLPLFFGFDKVRGAYADGLAELLQFEVNTPWIEALNVNYHIGLDGISLLLVMLTTFITPLCIWGSFTSIKERIKGYYIAFLFLETGMIGVFASMDLVLFYVFWEAMLIPMYLLIGIWGGPNKIYAAVKFILYTMVGSLLMLVGILWLYFNAVPGEYTFDLVQIFQHGAIPVKAQAYLFGAFALAFAIKVPMFPFHTWLPDAHVEAPTAGSIILAAVLLKMGTYGFLRFCLPLFPAAAHKYATLIIVLAIIGIIYGALVSMMQTDMKKLVAYSSVSHLGFVMLGLFAFNMQGMQGGTIQMINHGLSTGALFFLVGVIYERRHTRLISEYGGIAKVMPKYAAIFMIVALSSIGLPGLNGFVGEFLVLVGAFKAKAIYGILGASGVVFAAVYLLWMYQRVFFGEITNVANKKLLDLTTSEKAILIAFLVFIVWIGVYPSTFLSISENSVRMVLTRLGGV
ncbi:MAG: NADH-quinone oxidoreductase subunit M [Candidatus Hatepunaea meridiana]|nr:NADH-quinone oxidoreductase subunit M [Candidatus Hatepunaea meridiana]